MDCPDCHATESARAQALLEGRMSANQRDSFGSLQLGEVRTSGVTSELQSDDVRRLRIQRIEVRDLKLQTPLGWVSAATAALSNVTVRLQPTVEAGGPLDRLAGVTIG